MTVTIEATTTEQTRAVYPAETGFTERDGVRIYYEVYGHGEKTVLLMPTWSLVHSRAWKAQIGHLSRYYRVVTFDPRGNGRSDRPERRDDYGEHLMMFDAVDVLDATATARCVVVANSRGVQRAMLLAVKHPDRVAGLVAVAPMFIGTRWFMYQLGLARSTFDNKPVTTAWKFKWNGSYITERTDDFVDWFAHQMLNTPHSTKQIEDTTVWAGETTGTVIAESFMADLPTDYCFKAQPEFAAKVECPALVIHGSNDKVIPRSQSLALADAIGCRDHEIKDGGHQPHARKPAEFNRVLLNFCEQILGPGHEQPKSSHRGRGRRRALFVSSPIGLGHARRDLAVATSLREQCPDLEVEWFTQHPVTAMLEREGETVHPAARQLALESGHIEREAGEHDLHCFQAFRRMDEILIHNFMVYQDVVADGGYDVVVGDEAWDIDYFTHEHPSFKHAPYVWMTDFVGWLPMPEGGKNEAFLTADYNAEMIGHVEGNPGVRDRAIYVGSLDDLVPGAFGRNLPGIRDWTRRHYDFAGYITGFDPSHLGDKAELRAEFGYGSDEKVCIVTVGGSGVGLPLLRKVVDSLPYVREQIPNFRMVVVAGPRIDRNALAAAEGLQVHEYVHGLHRHLAACDLAVVQGGLTTTMELTASRVPFLYFPLENHFEQQYWVRHRLDRYNAGTAMSFRESDTVVIADAIVETISAEADYRPVETDGARRAAEMIAEVID